MTKKKYGVILSNLAFHLFLLLLSLLFLIAERKGKEKGLARGKTEFRECEELRLLKTFMWRRKSHTGRAEILEQFCTKISIKLS